MPQMRRRIGSLDDGPLAQVVDLISLGHSLELAHVGRIHVRAAPLRGLRVDERTLPLLETPPELAPALVIAREPLPVFRRRHADCLVVRRDRLPCSAEL